MDLEDIKVRKLIEDVRSEDETSRRMTISQIPNLILKSFEQRFDILNQLLLMIYNLNCDSAEGYEYFNENTKIPIIRSLFKLYTSNVNHHEYEQIQAFRDVIKHVQWSSEILVELVYVLHKCYGNTSKENTSIIDETLEDIEEKASANLFSQVLLIIHTIKSQPLFLTS